MAIPDYALLLSELQKLCLCSTVEDEDTRHNVADALRKASLSIESPLEVIRRISHGPIQLVAAKIGLDLNIFEVLKQEQTVSLERLVAKTNTEKILLVRLLRWLASLDLISQHTETTYGPAPTTYALCEPGYRAAVTHYFDIQRPTWFALPSFLASTSYMSPVSSSKTAFQQAHATSLPAFEWASQRPQVMRDFSLWMATQRQINESWLKVFTPAEIVESAQDGNRKSNQVLFVDVGGGIGYQSQALRSWLPLPLSDDIKIIFQDLPSVISMAKFSVSGIQGMAHDFFTPQPVKEARFYYLRNVLHDFPDISCISILKNIVPAMSNNSKILIDELVLPQKIDSSSRCTEWASYLDISVLAGNGGQERTRSSWEELATAAGLKVVDCRQYGRIGNSVLILEKEQIA